MGIKGTQTLPAPTPVPAVENPHITLQLSLSK